MLGKATKTNEGDIFGDKREKGKGKKHFVEKTSMEDQVAHILEHPLSLYTNSQNSQTSEHQDGLHPGEQK